MIAAENKEKHIWKKEKITNFIKRIENTMHRDSGHTIFTTCKYWLSLSNKKSLQKAVTKCVWEMSDQLNSQKDYSNTVTYY